MAKGNPTDSGLQATTASTEGTPPISDARSTSGTPRRYTRSNRRRNIVMIVVVLALIVGGVFFWRYLSTYESTDDAQVDVHLYPVSARVSGYVLNVNVDDNQ